MIYVHIDIFNSTDEKILNDIKYYSPYKSFFIDSEPSNRLENINFIEDLIFLKGRSFLQLQDGDWLGYKSEKFRLGLNFNKRPLYPLDYAAEDSLTEEVEPSAKAVKNICDSKK